MFKNNKVILLVLLIILAFVGYRYAFKKGVPFGDSALVTDSEENSDEQVIGKDLTITLSKLKSLTLDDTFFKDPVFISLNDFSVPLIPQEIGRVNPFSPISGLAGPDDSGVSSVSKKPKN